MDFDSISHLNINREWIIYLQKNVIISLLQLEQILQEFMWFRRQPSSSLITVVGQHETHWAQGGRGSFSDKTSDKDGLQSWLVCPSGDVCTPAHKHLWADAYTDTCRQKFGERRIWCKQAEKKSRTTGHATHHGESKKRGKKVGFTLSSSSLYSNLSLSRSSWARRAFKTRHTVLRERRV